MSTTETDATPGPGRISPGRAACEAFWAAVGAGPDTQDPTAAWDWAFAQNTTRAWDAAAEAAADARLTAAKCERDEARAELARAGERSTAATELTEGTRIQLARAMYDSIDRCARCKVCEHQIGAAAKVAGEAVRAERERAVAAEARLAEIASHVRDRLNAPGRAGMSRAAAGIILGLAEGSSEEENREH